MLAGELSFEVRMAVIYRSEKKKIIRAQLSLLKKVNDVLARVEKVMRDDCDPNKTCD